MEPPTLLATGLGATSSVYRDLAHDSAPVALFQRAFIAVSIIAFLQRVLLAWVLPPWLLHCRYR